MVDSTLILGKAGNISADVNIRPQLWLVPARDGNGDPIDGGYILCVQDKVSDDNQKQIIALLTEIRDLLGENNQQNEQKIQLLSGNSLGGGGGVV